MDIENKNRVHWSCRRGMRELDLLLMPFFEQCYDTLNLEQKQVFVRLLSFDDPILFNWFMQQAKPDDENIQAMIELILRHNQKNNVAD